MQRIVFAAVLATAVAGAVSAQTSAPAPPTTAPSTMKAEMKAMTGPWLGTQVWKQGVYDPSENRIGEIDNLVIGGNGQIEQAVVGVGGFLGIGEKNVAVNFADLKPMVRDGKIWFVLNKTKDELKAAPAFDTAKYKH